MPVRSYSGAAKATTLTGAVSAGATVINVVDATGWPSGTEGPFVITIDAGVTTEEKVLVLNRTGNSLTVSARGFDGTTASDHGNAASVQHTLSATDIREANAHVNDSTGDPHPQYLTPAEGAVLYATNAHGHSYADTAHSHTYDSITLKPAAMRFVRGTYTGDGTASQAVALGFEPAIVIATSTSSFTGMFISSIAAPASPLAKLGARLAGTSVAVSDSLGIRPTLTATGFTVSVTGIGDGMTCNQAGVVYHYLAIG